MREDLFFHIHQEVGDLENEIENLQVTATALSDSVASAQDAITDIQNTLAAKENKLADSEATQEALRTQIGNLSKSVVDSEKEVAELEEIAICQDVIVPPEIDYTSNQTVSTSLKTWLEDIKGQIDTAKWDLIWGNSRASIHKLTGEFLWVFLVKFDEPAIEHTSGVFWIDGGCYLDH